MIEEGNFKKIAEIFNGDIGDYYRYKSGPQLISFFNKYFKYEDEYKDFPSRWKYTSTKLIEMTNTKRIDEFLSLVLGKPFIMKDFDCREFEAVSKSKEILSELNKIVGIDLYTISRIGEHYILTKLSEDLEYITHGGFADIYLQKSTNRIVKKLQEKYVSEDTSRSRFRREYEITSSLTEVPGVIKVFEFNDDNWSYTMEKADCTLDEYISKTRNQNIEIGCVRKILTIMKEVHNREIIHRDLTPNNILVFGGEYKIADFGLGKDLNGIHSHITSNTNSLGQFMYSPPEQIYNLKDSGKQGDVYSLGKVINYIMTLKPNDINHMFKNAVIKAIAIEPEFRYIDAQKLLEEIEKIIERKMNHINKEKITITISEPLLEVDLDDSIGELTGEELCDSLIKNSSKYKLPILNYMKFNEEQACSCIQHINDNYRETCKNYESYDPFAQLSYDIVIDNYPIFVKEIAAQILCHIAHGVHRFSAQKLIKAAIRVGIEPQIEEILQNSIN